MTRLFGFHPDTSWKQPQGISAKSRASYRPEGCTHQNKGNDPCSEIMQ
jgi:hypothetical protein